MRESVIKSYVILFFFIAASTEIFSLFDAVTYKVILLFWIALIVFSLIFIPLFFKSSNHSCLIRKSLKAIAKSEFYEHLFLALLGVVLITTLLVSILAPPNNWDSMTYHMSRVVEWIQHKNVDFYPTSIERQNWLSPLAEFAILHLQLLSNSDRFANMVQWFSLCIAILLASLIAKEFYVSIRMQLFSAMVVATIPMAILQSSSTQNDIVAGTFCLGFVYFLLKLIKTLSFQNVIFCGLTLGLALLTKGTSYIYCGAIGLIIGSAYLLASKTWKMRRILLCELVLVIIIGLVINVGHFTRNYDLYAHPLSTKALNVKNEDFSIKILCSNLIRNAALHLGTPSRHQRWYTYRIIEIFLGNELNNPKTTIGNFCIPFSHHEDTAGNLIHFLLIGLIFLILPFVKMNDRKNVYYYAGAVAFAAILYCALIKWSPWKSRHHTPLFMLSSPLVAVAPPSRCYPCFFSNFPFCL